MFKQILFPVDELMFSSRISPQVESIARCQGSEITLLSVGNTSRMIEEAPSVSDDHLKMMRSTLERNLASFADDLKNKGFKVKWAYREGTPSDEIINYCDEIGCDLITLATHDRSEISWLLTSDAEKVATHSKVPVMISRFSDEEPDIYGRNSFVGP